MINHPNVSLTLLYLSWQNPALPAPHSLGFSRYGCANSWWWWSGGHLTVPWHCGTAGQSPGPSFHNLGLPSGQTARGLGLPSHGTAAPPQRTAWGSLWSSTQFLLQDIGSRAPAWLSEYIGQTPCRDRLIVSQGRFALWVLQNLFLE